jgi:hypothetical protein
METVVHVKTQAEYDALMEWCKKQGKSWYAKGWRNNFNEYPNICINVENQSLCYSPYDWYCRYSNEYTVVEFEDFKRDNFPFLSLPHYNCDGSVFGDILSGFNKDAISALRELGALDKFRANILRESEDVEEGLAKFLEARSKNQTARELVFNSFIWDNTPEGPAYWVELKDKLYKDNL